MLIEIAGVPAEVICRYPENERFLQDYASDSPPWFTVAPHSDDLIRMQRDFDRMDEADGVPKHKRPDGFLENNAIHALLAERLVEHDVLLMHGSALCMDGEAYIFTAESGTGKSTHARLWREVFGKRVWMINDDKPMLRIEESGVTVYGTPWDGKHHLSRNASAPLKAIVKLERDETNHIAPLAKADAFPVLMKQCYSSKHPATMARIMELEKRLLDVAELYRLGCGMTPDAAHVAWEAMRKNQGISRETGFAIDKNSKKGE